MLEAVAAKSDGQSRMQEFDQARMHAVASASHLQTGAATLNTDDCFLYGCMATDTANAVLLVHSMLSAA
jgi:hypothetical protein